MTNRKRFAHFLLCCCPLAAAGCVFDPDNLWRLQPEIPDLHPQREARAEEAVTEFDRKRNHAQFTAAQASWRQGDYERCRESLDKVFLRDPNHRPSLMLQADVELETDHPQEAVVVLRRLVSLDPNDAEAAYRLGVALEAAGQGDEALPYLRKAVERDPTNPMYAAALPEAERRLKKTDDATPADADEDAEFAAALADWEAGRNESATRAVAAFLRKQPNHIDANILQAEIDLTAGRRAEAMQRMDRLAVCYPDNVQVCRATGLLLQAMGNSEGAKRSFAQAQSLAERDTVVPASYVGELDAEPLPSSSSQSPPALLEAPEPPTVAELDAAERSTSGARQETATQSQHDVVAAAADPQVVLQASIEALKAEQPERAFELATQGTQKFPQSAGLHRVLGMAAYRLNRYPESEAALRKAIALDKSQALSYFLLGSVLDRLGRTEEGERYRSEAARLDARYALRK